MTVRVASKRGLQAISTGTRGSITGFLRSSLSAAKSSISGRWRNSSHISPTIVFGSIIIALKNTQIKFSLSAPPYLKKFPSYPTQKLCASPKREKDKIFIFRSTAVGLLCSYIVSRNQKTENNTRKTPDLTAQKLADKMKKTEENKEENNKSPDKQFLLICFILT